VAERAAPAIDPALAELARASTEDIGPRVAGDRAPLDSFIKRRFPPEILDYTVHRGSDGKVTVSAFHGDEELGWLRAEQHPDGGFKPDMVETKPDTSNVARSLYNRMAAETNGPWRGSLAQTEAGRGLVDRLRQTDPHLFDEAPAPDAVAPPSAALGAPATIYDHLGQPMADVRHAVMDLDQVQASHRVTSEGAIVDNPHYPPELQPRDRGRAATIEQVNGIASRFNPREVLDSMHADDGAPVVTPEGHVVAGNGRTLGIEEVYRRGRADQYRAALAAEAPRLGIDPATLQGMKRPALVRVLEARGRPRAPSPRPPTLRARCSSRPPSRRCRTPAASRSIPSRASRRTLAATSPPRRTASSPSG
jgi:hypothetical protein